MQHTRTPNFPLFLPSFKKHRSDCDQSGFRVHHLTLPKPPAVPSWASPLTPPMSGSPPPESPSDPAQLAGHRRKRSQSPPTTTTASAAISPPTPLEHPAHSTLAQLRGGLTTDVPAQIFSYSSSYPPPPPNYGAVAPMGVITANAPESLYAAGQVSPKTVRKTKAHVASACVNCKKKHLRCDNARPCRRCVQCGKEDTCKDTEHKKRGRPPLRPEDPTSRPRSFDPTMSVMPGPPPDSSRRLGSTDPGMYAPSAPYGRTFRPLQAQPPSYDPSRSHLRLSQSYPSYAQPSIQPSGISAMGSFVPSRQYGSAQLGTQPPSSYLMSPSEPARSAAGMYTSGYSYASPQEHMGMQAPQLYANPLFPRNQLPSPQDERTMGAASLQLPPIRPAAERSPIDPALIHPSQTSHGDPGRAAGRGADTTRLPDPKRPRMDLQRILEPRQD